jgi:SpoVK/Ycf46/Vps4 family AAA+-type ATPase
MIDQNTYFQLHPYLAGGGDRVDRRGGDLPPSVLASDTPPKDPFVLLIPSTIKGYNVHDKKWGTSPWTAHNGRNTNFNPPVDVQVENLTDVSWNTKAFENLVTDPETKDLIEALVKNQLDAEKATDLIDGKGNGLIILLHGGPGTGKTFTAESVAEIAKKPLYRVTCGDVGTKPEDVEEYLQSVLHLGKIWGCVVLLDEADIFLEERTLSDLQRNALVSVFLRVLEYYSGILILTSNRVGTFDEAFKSRIQLALRYENLNRDQRRQIWANFIEHIRSFGEQQAVDFEDITRHLDDLAVHEMNGRQIRNAITTGRQLAEFRGTSLDFQMLQKVIKVAGRFDKYLEEVKQAKELQHGRFDDQMARDAGTR